MKASSFSVTIAICGGCTCVGLVMIAALLTPLLFWASASTRSPANGPAYIHGVNRFSGRPSHASYDSDSRQVRIAQDDAFEDDQARYEVVTTAVVEVDILALDYETGVQSVACTDDTVTIRFTSDLSVPIKVGLYITGSSEWACGADSIFSKVVRVVSVLAHEVVLKTQRGRHPDLFRKLRHAVKVTSKTTREAERRRQTPAHGFVVDGPNKTLRRFRDAVQVIRASVGGSASYEHDFDVSDAKVVGTLGTLDEWLDARRSNVTFDALVVHVAVFIDDYNLQDGTELSVGVDLSSFNSIELLKDTLVSNSQSIAFPKIRYPSEGGSNILVKSTIGGVAPLTVRYSLGGGLRVTLEEAVSANIDVAQESRVREGLVGIRYTKADDGSLKWCMTEPMSLFHVAHDLGIRAGLTASTAATAAIEFQANASIDDLFGMAFEYAPTLTADVALSSTLGGECDVTLDATLSLQERVWMGVDVRLEADGEQLFDKTRTVVEHDGQTRVLCTYSTCNEEPRGGLCKPPISGGDSTRVTDKCFG